MKIFFCLLLLAFSAMSQPTPFGPIQYVTADPTGNACGATAIALRTPNGTLYTCQSGVYASAGQPAGDYITALTGDVVASGPGSVGATLQPLAGISSSSSNIASTGWLKLASGNTICWRNASNNANLGFSVVTDGIMGIGNCTGGDASASLQLTGFYANSSARASVGFGRLAKTDQLCFRNSNDTGDICLTVVANGILGVSDGTVGAGQNSWFATAYLSAASNRAATGVLRLASADTVCWRDNANSADVCLSKNSSDQFLFPNIIRYNGGNTTGAGTALLGTNSPAVTVSAPYTWFMVVTSDGSTGYIPVWK